MRSVVLVSDNVNLINCWFCPLFNYDSGPPLWKQGQVCYISPDLAVSVYTLHSLQGKFQAARFNSHATVCVHKCLQQVLCECWGLSSVCAIKGR